MQKLEFQLIIREKGTETVGNVTTNPSRCISEVASSGPSGCENSNTTQGTDLDNTLRQYKMLFLISLAMMAVLITVLVVVIFQLVKKKNECLSLISKLQGLGKLSAQEHASDAGEEPHYCPLRGKGHNSEIYTHLPGQS